MALTGQTPGIPDYTYRGLLNINNDALGLTASLRNVKDGLGNNSGIRLSTAEFEYSGIFTFASKTASTLIYLNASKQVTSLANAAGVLTNDGAGNFSYAAVASGITIDTTAITSGTAGRLLLESATNKVTESANLAVNTGMGIFNIGYDVIIASAKRLTVGGYDGGSDLNVFSTSGGQLAVGYDSGNFLQVAVNSGGQAEFTLAFSGVNPLFTFYSPIYARVRPRAFATNAPGATPGIDTNDEDFHHFTGLNTAITSMTTNLGGVPTEAQKLWLAFTDNGTARAITWGASFENGAATLPTTTVASTRLDVGFIWNTITSKWRCVAAG